MLKNEEIQALIQAIGAGLGDEFDLEKIRYHKIVRRGRRCLGMAAHIQPPPLTFFYRQIAELVKNGFVYIAQPPR